MLVESTGELFCSREKEGSIFKKFLEDPAEGAKEILRRYKIGAFCELEELKEEGDLLLEVLEKYAEEKGWVFEDQSGGKHFIWEWETIVCADEKLLPLSIKDYEKLREVKMCLEELKRKGLEEFLEIKATGIKLIFWSAQTLIFDNELASKILGRKVKDGEKLSFEEAEKIVDRLLERWRRFSFSVAKQKGLLYEDKDGRERFIWERNITVKFTGEIVSLSPSGVESLEKIRDYLEELKQKGAQEFLKIWATEAREIAWTNNTLTISADLCTKVLGGEVKEGERLSFGVALEVVKDLLNVLGR